jgi:hypothetical protein
MFLFLLCRFIPLLSLFSSFYPNSQGTFIALLNCFIQRLPLISIVLGLLASDDTQNE